MMVGSIAVAALAVAASASAADQRLLSDACGEEHRRVIIAGAGLAGLATAVALHKVHGRS
jgi:NADPH-dependent 2,4-dienoyl-CoA reductase/sulfur reductase-like enzyme